MGWRNLSYGETEMSTEGCGHPKSLRVRIDDKYISKYQNQRQVGRRKALEIIDFKRSKHTALTWEWILCIESALSQGNPSRLPQPQTVVRRRCYLCSALDATERSAWKLPVLGWDALPCRIIQPWTTFWRGHSLVCDFATNRDIRGDKCAVPLCSRYFLRENKKCICGVTLCKDSLTLCTWTTAQNIFAFQSHKSKILKVIEWLLDF